VPGGGRGSSNKSNPATAGKAPVLYHKNWRPVNHANYPIQVYDAAQLRSRRNAMRRAMTCGMSLHLMMHVHAAHGPLDWRSDERASLRGPTISL
jgi:hypothetical protein